MSSGLRGHLEMLDTKETGYISPDVLKESLIPKPSDPYPMQSIYVDMQSDI